MSTLANPMRADSESRFGVGIIVDAGPTMGYGHAVRCMRLAEVLGSEIPVTFYPMSADCEALIRETTPNADIRNPKIEPVFPAIVVTDLREPQGITAVIRRSGARHISIHDLGLAQCQSDVVIDGSITRLFPYPENRERALFLGPQYMITRPAVARSKELSDTVLVTFGGGRTTAFSQKVMEEICALGLRVVATRGFIGSGPMSDADFATAMSTCRFAISGSGVSLYDLLASGVPTIAVAFDRLQLRTADAFHERGAVLSAGVMENLSSGTLLRLCIEMIENRQLVDRMSQIGQMLVDGKGISRVVEIVRRELWLTSQIKTSTAC